MWTVLLLCVGCASFAGAAEDEGYRLNGALQPAAYQLTITPYFDTGDGDAFSYTGRVSVTFTAVSATNQIKLHSEQLNYTAANVTLTTGNAVVPLSATDPLVFDERYTFAIINLQSDLQTNTNYSLTIHYRGPIRDDLKGFYRNYYIENGQKKWLGATQLEPTHARKVFPCWDEPALKASFELSLDRPAHYPPSLANTRLRVSENLTNGYIRDTFYPTPRMSTYLVAFLVSEFTAGRHSTNGTKEFGVWTRPEANNQSDYAFEFGIKVVNALSEYFGIDYYSTNEYLKLDHIALPDFNSGAMENWGLIKYREALLLYVPEESTPYYKYRVAQIVAHETTHMWFGNLVTCHWWSDTWLNEGFANYFQDYITSFVEPGVGAGDQLVAGSVYAAYEADAAADAPPVSNAAVGSPAEISAHFGTISYQKAGSIIRMTHHLLGDDAFRIGLKDYLLENQFAAGRPGALYAALARGAASTGALAPYPGAALADVLAGWVTQPGHPLLHVAVDYDTGNVTLTQNRFYLNSSEQSDEIYPIPITYTTGASPNFENTKPSFIMTGRTHSFTIDNLNHSWVIFNIQETGLYRVNYDENTWEHIISALSGADRDKIHYLNRAKIINDLFALWFADAAPLALVRRALAALEGEAEFAVWAAAVRGLDKLRSRFLGNEALTHIDALIEEVVGPALERLGYEGRAGEGTVAQRNRMQLLQLACGAGHAACLDSMARLFDRFRDNGTLIAPHLRPAAYCAGLRRGGAPEYELLWRRMAGTNVANEARVIADALGCTRQEDKLKEYLVSAGAVEGPVRAQDREVPLGSVLAQRDHLPLLLRELNDSYALWATIYPTMDSVLSSIASALRTEDEFTQFESWLSSCVQCTAEARAAAAAALGAARAGAAWAAARASAVADALRGAAARGLPSHVLLALATLAALYFRP